jgi:S1-C subfamily serine protease
VLAVGGHAISQSADVAAAVGRLAPGRDVQLSVRRGGGERTVTAKLGTRPTQASG